MLGPDFNIRLIVLKPSKRNFHLAVDVCMDDNALVKFIWNILALKQRFERNPYSLSRHEIDVLRDYQDYLASKIVKAFDC